MNIENNVNHTQPPTFQARRILAVDKLTKKLQNESVDVFQLSSEDKDFARNCVAVLSERKELNKFQTGLKNFFKMFINDAVDSDTNSFHRSQNYYLSVKDGEEISGYTHSFQLDDVVSVNGGGVSSQDKLNRDSLLYGVLQSAKEAKGEEIYGAGTLAKVFKLDSEFMHKKEYMKKAREIKKANPEATFVTKQVKDVNLEKYLGIEF